MNGKQVAFGLIIALVAWTVWHPRHSLAASFAVNTTNDTVDANPGNGTCADSASQCSLRAAVMEANALGGANTVTLPANTYSLTITGRGENTAAQGDIDITAGTLTISGAGAATTIIDGGDIDRIFDLFTGTTVTISGVTIRNGTGEMADSSTFNQSNGGGAIRSYESNLTLSQVSLLQNVSESYGGALSFNYTRFGRPARARLTITGGLIEGNLAVLNGGGVIIGGGTTLAMTNATIHDNRANSADTSGISRYGGGGLYVGQGYTPIGGSYVDTIAVIQGTTFDDNFTTDDDGTGQISGSAWGGAIHLEKATVTIGASTFSNNQAEGTLGGAIYSDGANLKVTGSTFTANSVLGDGGAIYAAASPSLTVSGSSFTANASNGDVLSGGGAIYAGGTESGGRFDLNDSRFEMNTSTGSGGALQLGPNTLAQNIEVIGNTAGSNAGGIRVQGSTLDAPVVIINALIENNRADVRGGGIDNSAVLYLRDSMIRGNRTVQAEGGGLSSYQSFATNVTNTTIFSNTAASHGGGIYDRHGTFGANGNDPRTSLFTNVTVEGNTAMMDGGGVYNFVSTKFVNSTITGNHAADGGGILTYSNFSFSSERQLYPINLELVNVTVDGNTASARGAGIYQNGGVTSLTSATLSGNTAVTSGGGVHYDSTNPGDTTNPNTFTIRNSIIALNSAAAGPDCANTVTSAGHNLLRDNTGCALSSGTADQVGTGGSPIDPSLMALAANGGPTWTRALQSGSPAINAGDQATCPAADQRNAPRVGTCDIGAYEFGSVPWRYISLPLLTK